MKQVLSRKQFKAPLPLGKSITKAKSKEQLKPLLQAYAIIYGDIPDILCQMYKDLPDKA